MFEVKKKDHESLDGLLRRFHRKVQQSGVIIQAKKVRYYERPKSKQRQRKEAIRRTELREERDTLKKLGKLEERTHERFGGY
jgi:small subunit ribosomal protein S21